MVFLVYVDVGDIEFAELMFGADLSHHSFKIGVDFLLLDHSFVELFHLIKDISLALE